MKKLAMFYIPFLYHVHVVSLYDFCAYISKLVLSNSFWFFMRSFLNKLLLPITVVSLHGCGSGEAKGGSQEPSSTTSDPTVLTSTISPVSSSSLVPSRPPSSDCSGKKLGQYTWGTELWRQGATELSSFFSTVDGKEWGCGDVTINIGDYTAPRVIAYENDIIPFILAYRRASMNYESVVWLSYGDVISGDGSLMDAFIDTFFRWAASIPTEIASTLGTIGLSFDVEHIDPSVTSVELQKAQRLKASTNFAPGKLLIQHTIEGKLNPDQADFVMRYADSALIMLYRNYMQSPLFAQDSNILSRAAYFLQQQCVRCLDDSYAISNYQAKITMMVEASCAPTDYCAKISFCAHDSPGEGAVYLWNTLEELQTGMISSGLLTPAQFSRLFNPATTFSVHDWSWFRCFAPLTASAGRCSGFQAAAESCRNTLGPVSTSAP
jgi:hypothetical protein